LVSGWQDCAADGVDRTDAARLVRIVVLGVLRRGVVEGAVAVRVDLTLGRTVPGARVRAGEIGVFEAGGNGELAVTEGRSTSMKPRVPEAVEPVGVNPPKAVTVSTTTNITAAAPAATNGHRRRRGCCRDCCRGSVGGTASASQ
jgi:hypothetical protein